MDESPGSFVMGVKGLLQTLRSITRPVKLDKYRGLTAAIDAMAWLHRGIYNGDVRSLAHHQWHGNPEAVNPSYHTGSNDPRASEARRLDFDSLVPLSHSHPVSASASASSSMMPSVAASASSKCIEFVMRQVASLIQEYGIEVILVIDGGSLPSKSRIDANRRIERREAYEKALIAEAKGDSRNARKMYARSCSITHEIRHELVLACKRARIHFVVAPYEADAQLAQMAHSGAADIVITEDSDMLAYGCPRILFKTDLAGGTAEEIQLMRDLASNDRPSYRSWTHDMFVYMCIVNGCDYCEGINGLGIKTAHKLVRMHRSPAKIFKALRAAGRMPVGFEDDFWMAYRTFRHQSVYNPNMERMEPLLPETEIVDWTDKATKSGDDPEPSSYLGPLMDAETVKGVAKGILHPAKRIPWSTILASAESRDRLGKNPLADSTNRTMPAPPRESFKFFPSKIAATKGVHRKGETEAISRSREALLPPSRPVPGLSKSFSSQSIPIHFDQYSSRLVGEKFVTMSRMNKGYNASNNVSLAVRRLKANAIQKAKGHSTTRMKEQLKLEQEQPQSRQTHGVEREEGGDVIQSENSMWQPHSTSGADLELGGQEVWESIEDPNSTVDVQLDYANFACSNATNDTFMMRTRTLEQDWVNPSIATSIDDCFSVMEDPKSTLNLPPADTSHEIGAVEYSEYKSRECLEGRRHWSTSPRLFESSIESVHGNHESFRGMDTSMSTVYGPDEVFDQVHSSQVNKKNSDYSPEEYHYRARINGGADQGTLNVPWLSFDVDKSPNDDSLLDLEF